ERVGSVFEIVGGPQRRRGQLARFANRREAGAYAVRDRGAKNEPPALDADDDVDRLFLERRRQTIDGRFEAGRILQQRGDVVKEDPRLREIRHVTDLALQVVHVHVRSESADLEAAIVV